MSLTTIGASPMDGSSTMMSFGRGHERPADGQHLPLAAAQRARHLVPALLQDREPLVDPLAGCVSTLRMLWCAPSSRLSSTLIEAKTPRPSGTRQMPARTLRSARHAR